MRAIAQISSEFALEAVPFLVDMFNDEISSVRVLAVEALRSMHNVVQLDDEQARPSSNDPFSPSLAASNCHGHP